MTTKAQITKVASRDGVDAHVVERDYVLAHIVALIAANEAEKRLVFKGGTSLRLLHVEGYRYSATWTTPSSRAPRRTGER